jgi:hypothetical protein
MPDDGTFQSIVLPLIATFWRGGRHDRLTHASPIMKIEGASLGIHGIDILHSWALGPCTSLVAYVFTIFLLCPSFSGALPWMDAEDSRKCALLRLKGLLWAFYRNQRSHDPNWKKHRSELWNLTEDMLGKRYRPELKAKAAETRILIPFCVEILTNFMYCFVAQGGDAHLRAQFMLGATESGVEFERILRAELPSGRSMSRAAQLDCWSAYMRHEMLCRRAGMRSLPKHHCMQHLVKRICFKGNPLSYSTYRDESLNGVIARIAASCHRRTFGMSVHEKYIYLQATGGSTEMS